ncbi:MAG: pyridoxamine 5'-phosphate oxidase family protein [Acidobacteriota bacterium]
MGKIFDSIDDDLRAFLGQQQMFFVATAPMSADGLVNVSPKGLDTFRVLGPTTVAYLDLGGSGIETVAHVKENGRIVFMFCAFDGRPRIVRFYGRGEVLEPGQDAYGALLPEFPAIPGARTIIKAELHRIADSCGWGVPLYEFQGQRDQLPRYAESLGPEKIAAKRRANNSSSLDDLPGLSFD